MWHLLRPLRLQDSNHQQTSRIHACGHDPEKTVIGHVEVIKLLIVCEMSDHCQTSRLQYIDVKMDLTPDRPWQVMWHTCNCSVKLYSIFGIFKNAWNQLCVTDFLVAHFVANHYYRVGALCYNFNSVTNSFHSSSLVVSMVIDVVLAFVLRVCACLG